jgi:hypothetical protein
MIYVPDYWPLFKTSELRRFDYTDPTGSMPPITSVFAYDKGTDSMLYIDYDAHLTWKDTWYYKVTSEGLMEWRDDYPGKKVVMSPGIGWGGMQEIGGSYVNKPKMSPFQSWPPAMASGVQICAYEQVLDEYFVTRTEGRGTASRLYRDVLVFTYLQSWSGKPGGGARYWMAKGVGPVSVQWLAQDPTDPYSKPLIQTARMDAVVTSVGGLTS